MFEKTPEERLLPLDRMCRSWGAACGVFLAAWLAVRAFGLIEVAFAAVVVGWIAGYCSGMFTGWLIFRARFSELCSSRLARMPLGGPLVGTFATSILVCCILFAIAAAQGFEIPRRTVAIAVAVIAACSIVWSLATMVRLGKHLPGGLG